MIQINLLPEELRKKEPVRVTLPEMPDKKTIRLALLVFFGIQLALGVFAVIQRVEFFMLSKEVSKLTAENKEVTQHKTEMDFMSGRMKDIRQLTQRKFYSSSFLDALTHSMTKGIWLRGLRFEYVKESAEAKKNAPAKKEKGAKSGKAAEKPKEKAEPARVLRIEGSVIGQGQETAYVGKFIKSLKDNEFMSGVLGDVTLSGMNQKKIKDYDVYDFIVLCPVKKDRF